MISSVESGTWSKKNDHRICSADCFLSMNIQTADREGGAAIDTRKAMGALIGSFVLSDPPIPSNHIPPGDESTRRASGKISPRHEAAIPLSRGDDRNPE
jgi:hypothetical protein